ncbi:MAG: biopolymer transporter ExbD [Verrucomicrobia bacterium]|nr:biopolymer transporter ExbD [Verrucomicrobiota bacterium]
MQFRTRLKTSQHLIDLTPLVDVIFLMLIFFLISSEILPLKSLLIEVPELPTDQPARLAQLIVVMDDNQVIYIGSKKEIIDMGSVKDRLTELINAMKSEYPNYSPTVVLNVDRRVDFGAFMRLFSQVQECSPRIRLSFNSRT